MEGQKLRFLIVIMLVLLIQINISGQTTEEQRAIFAEAESHYLFGEYELANPLYLILNEFMPDNANIRFKIGDSYLNIPDERSKAIGFLEDAVRSSDVTARPESFRETKAPLEAWFSLATAYRINNELDKAINTYQTYLKYVTEAGSDVNIDFVRQQITACRNAVRLMQEPVGIEKINLGSGINRGSVNLNPAVSFDGNSMVYTENRGLENALFYTIRENGVWQTPVEITTQLGEGWDCHPTSLNADGTELYLYKNDNFDGNIYVSKLVEGSWTKMKKLNRNINTKYYESHASVSADGQRLYFTSNRTGGFGELDIYVSERGTDDNWGRAVNLGQTVNTPFNENTPFITADGSWLYFSSEGHTTMGGYDILRSLNIEDSWKTPENIGYPINSTDDDLFFQPFENGESGYYSLITGYKNREIFKIEIGEIASNYNYVIKGVYSLADTTLRFTENYAIHLINLVKGDTLDISFPNEFSGLYSFIIRPGTYRISYTGIGYISQHKDTTVTNFHPTGELTINVSLERDPDYRPENVSEPAQLYDKIDLAAIPTVTRVDSAMLRTDIVIKDLSDTSDDDSLILYYTVQVMALHIPVDASYFQHIDDIVIIYNELDKFYRYTSGRFRTKEEAYSYRLQLIAKGYPDDLFIKKALRE